MQDELRLSLLIAGTLFIIAIFAHGMWKIRKQSKPEEKKSRLEPRSWEIDDNDEHDEDESSWREEDMGRKSETLRDAHNIENFDELGLGKVRVVRNQAEETQITPVEGKEGEVHVHTEAEVVDEEPAITPDAEAEPKLYGSVVTNPKPHMQNQRNSLDSDKEDIPEPPGFLLKRDAEKVPVTPSEKFEPQKSEREAEVDDFCLDPQPAPQHLQESAESETAEGESLGEQARRFMSRKRSKASAKKGRQEPKFGDDQMRIDFDDPLTDEVATSGAEEKHHQESKLENNEKPTLPEQEVLVLNVKAAEDAPISGAALLPMLLTLGFKFGEQDIFHRHVNSNGKGPVLFSLANMFKPGVFDIDNLETFTTQGVSLFMILPIEGDAHQVFNMMHNAARKIADEFGAQVLDGRRSIMTKQGLQQYIERIRDFERLRMINR
ncbi:cell division protein ZipA [Alteromonas sp. ASW11-130]|uniref:cell division protein ZipA n=1 Tax=Alteromonas sp. ASW11-130 TaxID=3015775 RepID=UPI002242218E|nr:cell division protein ZipA [Alteromonas sp. ASW11-130]MCW8092152.1 cell division protein ZipA [Alteromonas sp. ASW11-130]